MELEKLLDDLLEKVKVIEEHKSNLDKHREEIVETATKNAKKAKMCFVSISEYGVQVNGSVASLLAGLSSFTNKLMENGVPKELILDAAKAGLKKESDIEEMLNKLMED